jgi:hypothetical protein
MFKVGVRQCSRVFQSFVKGHLPFEVKITEQPRGPMAEELNGE